LNSKKLCKQVQTTTEADAQLATAQLTVMHATTELENSSGSKCASASAAALTGSARAIRAPSARDPLIRARITAESLSDYFICVSNHADNTTANRHIIIVRFKCKGLTLG
jgi:hypothetical protein